MGCLQGGLVKNAMFPFKKPITLNYVCLVLYPSPKMGRLPGDCQKSFTRIHRPRVSQGFTGTRCQTRSYQDLGTRSDSLAEFLLVVQALVAQKRFLGICENFQEFVTCLQMLFEIQNFFV